jgi:glycosyltransferase involved in cell wall biosynthesis
VINNKKILTIAIPTYNGHYYLLKQILNINQQLNEHIDFYVIDNCSEPPVQEYLEIQGLTTKGIKILRNKINIGVDANILKCIELCDTKWIWVLSDNDLIKKNAIDTALKEINLHHDSIYINFGNRYNIVTDNYVSFCKYLNYSNSFTISNCLYNIFKLKECIAHYKEHIDTHQAQILYVLKYLEEHRKTICVLSDKQIINWSLEPKWRSIEFVLDTHNIYNAPSEMYRPIFKCLLDHKILSMQIYVLTRDWRNMKISTKQYYSNIYSLIKVNPAMLLLKGSVLYNLMLFYWFVIKRLLNWSPKSGHGD